MILVIVSIFITEVYSIVEKPQETQLCIDGRCRVESRASPAVIYEFVCIQSEEFRMTSNKVDIVIVFYDGTALVN
jgi:hypothetical protein